MVLSTTSEARSPYLSSAVYLTLPVMPDARLMAPTAEGPKVEP